MIAVRPSGDTERTNGQYSRFVICLAGPPPSEGMTKTLYIPNRFDEKKIRSPDGDQIAAIFFPSGAIRLHDPCLGLNSHKSVARNSPVPTSNCSPSGEIRTSTYGRHSSQRAVAFPVRSTDINSRASKVGSYGA